MQPRTYRSRRFFWLSITVVMAALLVVGTLRTGLSAPEKVFGCLFYAGVCIAVAAQVIRTIRPDSKSLRPCPFDGRHGGRELRGIAFPVRAPGTIRWFGAAVIGVGLASGGAFIGVTGRGVDGGVGTRVVATVLCGLFGLILFFGGLARMRAPASPSRDWLVFARDGVHVPDTVPPQTVSWSEIGRLDRHVLPGNPSRASRAIGARYEHDRAGREIVANEVRENDVVDILDTQGQRLARINVTQVPHPGQLVAVMEAVRQDPGLQARLGDSDRDRRLHSLTEAGIAGELFRT